MNNEVLFIFFQGSAPIVILFPIYWPCKWAHHTVSLCESIAACEHWRLYLEIQFLTQMRGPKGLCTKWTKLFSFPNGHCGQAITSTAMEGCYYLKNKLKKNKRKKEWRKKRKIQRSSITGTLEKSLQFISLYDQSTRSYKVREYGW